MSEVIARIAGPRPATTTARPRPPRRHWRAAAGHSASPARVGVSGWNPPVPRLAQASPAPSPAPPAPSTRRTAAAAPWRPHRQPSAARGRGAGGGIVYRLAQPAEVADLVDRQPACLKPSRQQNSSASGGRSAIQRCASASANRPADRPRARRTTPPRARAAAWPSPTRTPPRARARRPPAAATRTGSRAPTWASCGCAAATSRRQAPRPGPTRRRPSTAARVGRVPASRLRIAVPVGARHALAHRDDVRARLAADLEDLAADPIVADRVARLAAIAEELHAARSPAARSPASGAGGGAIEIGAAARHEALLLQKMRGGGKARPRPTRPDRPHPGSRPSSPPCRPAARPAPACGGARHLLGEQRHVADTLARARVSVEAPI